MTSFNYIVTETDQQKRIDLLVTQLQSDYSRSQIQKWILSGLVTVNGKQVKSNYKCQINDEIHWKIQTDKHLPIIPENIPLNIVYEDHDLLVINKPKGMVVHPTASHQNGTLVHALLFHCKQLSTLGGTDRPGIVHRLDKDTLGLLVVAKTDTAYRSLTQQLKERKAERIYEAIVEGVIEHESGLIDAPIGRDPKHRLKMSVVDDGKQAITHFRVLERFDKHTHVVCQLETGRTHQIRVHMDYIGNPLVGDPKYSRKGMQNEEGQALFAQKLSFIHPSKNEWISFEVERPSYFLDILREIKNKA